MNNSSWLIYSIIKNVYVFLKKDDDINLLTKCHIRNFQNASNFFREQSKRIYNEIENNYYTIYDFILVLLYQAMIYDKIQLYEIKVNNVKNILQLFTTNQLQNDLELLKHIYQELKLKHGLLAYFEIKEDGTNIIYNLIKKQKISPILFIRNFKKFLTTGGENGIIKNTEYLQFEKIANKLQQTFQGGPCNECSKV
jgi:hypothetical protein